MRVKLISDLHTEFYTQDQRDNTFDWLPHEGVDVLVVAGDLSVGFKKRLKHNIKALCKKFPHVVYVLGNHDVWGGSIDRRIEQFTRLDERIENFHFLENRRIEIDGQWFAGCTLWFPDSFMTRSTWCDFRSVEGGSHVIHQQNAKSQEFLRREVQEGDIVVTHHLPSQMCVTPEWEGNPSNCYFVCEMDEVIHNNKPAMWLYGHTHGSNHFMIGETEMFCNPKGYPHEGVSCDVDLIIDTELEKYYGGHYGIPDGHEIPEEDDS